MSLLTEAVSQEQQRIKCMMDRYQSELLSLPKGSLIIKKIKGNSYYYLQYRDGQKTISKYIGKDDEKVHELQEKIKRRKHVQAMLRALQEEYILAQKMMEVHL